uniref:Uncharacterized protein n=1 Tax=Glossina pallidipes TaxID=7398 RepID=A0A1A9ZQJ7_GLOPL
MLRSLFYTYAFILLAQFLVSGNAFPKFLYYRATQEYPLATLPNGDNEYLTWHLDNPLHFYNEKYGQLHYGIPAPPGNRGTGLSNLPPDTFPEGTGSVDHLSLAGVALSVNPMVSLIRLSSSSVSRRFISPRGIGSKLSLFSPSVANVLASVMAAIARRVTGGSAGVVIVTSSIWSLVPVSSAGLIGSPPPMPASSSNTAAIIKRVCLASALVHHASGGVRGSHLASLCPK